MTAKQVITINFTEINKVEITCLNCGAGLILPVAKPEDAARNIPIRLECMGCKQVLWESQADQRYLRFMGLVSSLWFWQEMKQDHLGFDVSFSLNSN
jgi:hypothetical protein